MASSDRVVERQRVFKQYKEDVKERGKKFFPYAMLHDTIMSLVVVTVIIALSVVWKFSVPGDHTSVESGWLGKLYDEPAESSSGPSRWSSARSACPRCACCC